MAPRRRLGSVADSPNYSFKGNQNRTDFGPLNSGVRPKVSAPLRDTFPSWFKFLFGAFLLCTGAVSLFSFVTTGIVRFGPSGRFPVEFGGETAALVYVVYLTVGALLVVSGVKGLTRK
jgi:hypothetical protein